MRFGKKHQPTYRVVVSEARSKAKGEAIEHIGFYNPRSKPSEFTVNADRVKYWLGVGAQPTQTVAYLLTKEKLFTQPKQEFKSKPGRKKQERAAKEAA